MIARIWHGRTREDRADAYTDYIRSTGITAHRGTEGNLGSWILRARRGDTAEFLVVSLWKSMEAVRRFAGPHPEVPIYYEEDDAFLLEREKEVLHYDVVEGDVPGASSP